MKLLRGASEWSPKEKWQITKISVEVFVSGGLLVYRGQFTLISPVGLVKSFPPTRIKNDGSPSALRCRSQFAIYIFCFLGLWSGRGAKIRMRFKGLFWRRKVTGA